MKMARRATLIAIVPLALGVGAGFVALTGRSDGAGEVRSMENTTSGMLGILTQHAQASDRLPAFVLASPAAEQFGDTSAARLAATTGIRRYFVVPGRGSSVCLIFAEGSGATATSGGTCASRATLRTGAVYLSEPLPDGTATIAGIVSNGINRATAGSATAAVQNNMFVLHGATSPTVALDGADVALDVDVGLAAPTATVTTPQ